MDESARVESIDADTTATARSDVAGVELEGEIVLYDDGSHRLHRLNPTAATLWQCLDGSASLGEIATDIADVYQVDVTTVLPQIISLTQSFAAEGLLVGFEHPTDESTNGEERGSDVGPFIEEAPSPCMDPNFTLGEEGTMAVRAGGHLVGLRVSTVELARAARAVLAPALVEGVTAPPNVSVVETRAGAGRPIFFCYRSGWLVARARSLRRALSTAAVLLSSYDERVERGFVRVQSLVAVRDGRATLFIPESRNLLAMLVPRLHSTGWQVSELPWALLRPDAGSVIISPLSFEIDQAALESLPADRRETVPPEPGEYPVAAWVSAPLYELDTSTLAGRITQVAQGSPDLKRDAPLVFDTVRNMLQKATWRASAAFDAASLIRSANA